MKIILMATPINRPGRRLCHYTPLYARNGVYTIHIYTKPNVICMWTRIDRNGNVYEMYAMRVPSLQAEIKENPKEKER